MIPSLYFFYYKLISQKQASKYHIKGEFILHIYLLGATGRVGNNILNAALNDGHQVSVLTRSREKLKIKSPLLTIYEGDVLNKADLLHSMKDCDVVISALNTDRSEERRVGKLYISWL